MLSIFKKIKWIHLSIVILLAFSAYFRFRLLGYSDFQGDEAKVFLFLKEDSFLSFILKNSKGPGQYLVAWGMESLALKSIDTELLFRSPFAYINFIATILAFYIPKRFFNLRTALYTLALFSLNGFFIAFSRIVQYQSFLIFLSLLSSLFFLIYLNKSGENRKFLFFAGLTSSIGLLFHYDAFGFIVAQIILLFISKKSFKDYLIYGSGLLTCLVFYVPYVLHDNFLLTFQYLLNDRAVSNFSYDSIFYSTKLLQIYFSKEFIIIFLSLLFGSLWALPPKKILLYRMLLIGLVFVIITRYFVGHPYKPLILLSLLIFAGLFCLFIYSKKINHNYKYFLVWFFVTFGIYALFLNKPLTHIYNIFLPASFLVSYQLYKLKGRFIKYFIVIVLVVSSLSFNNKVYIENKTEYPWESEKYIFGGMYSGISEGEIVRGIFGFPYYRRLDTLEANLNLLIPENVTPVFYTNIKLSRLDFYIKSDYPTDKIPQRYYIEIKDSRDYEDIPEFGPQLNKRELLVTDGYSIYQVE